MYLLLLRSVRFVAACYSLSRLPPSACHLQVFPSIFLLIFPVFFSQGLAILEHFQVVVFHFSERGHTSEAGHFSNVFLFHQLQLPVALPLCVIFNQLDVHRPSNHLLISVRFRKRSSFLFSAHISAPCTKTD